MVDLFNALEYPWTVGRSFCGGDKNKICMVASWYTPNYPAVVRHKISPPAVLRAVIHKA